MTSVQPSISLFERNGRPRILLNVVYLLLNSVGRAAIGATVVPGLGDEWRDAIDDYVEVNGKVTKRAVLYSPVAPPPVFWEYNCGNCWAFERETQRCKWVTEQGWPNPGIIHPQGWCVIWVPREGDPPLSYLGRLPWFLREQVPVIP